MVVNAQQDRVPLVVLTGCVDPEETLTYTHQIFNHRSLFDPITKATFTLLPSVADVIAEKAVAIATGDRPGPVHIDVPIAVADALIEKSNRSRHTAISPTAPAEGEASLLRASGSQKRRDPSSSRGWTSSTNALPASFNHLRRITKFRW